MKKVFEIFKARKTQILTLVIVIFLIVFVGLNTQVYYFVDECGSYWPEQHNPCIAHPWSSYEVQVETEIMPLTWTRLSLNNDYEDGFRSLSVGLGIVVDSWTD